MSRREIAVCLGLLISGWNSAALAQQSAEYGYGGPGSFTTGQPIGYPQQPAYQQSASPQPVFQQPVYQQSGSQTSPPSYQAGFHRPAPAHYQGGLPQQQGYYQQNVNCGTCYQEPSAFWTSYYRNIRWPMPFRAQDVSSVTAYFDVQRENGWRLRNTVGHAMFDPRTNSLTDAGKSHVRSILRDNPPDRRAVFVFQGQNQQQTASRVQSTELAISELLPVGDLPPVYLTDRDAPGSSGAYQAAVMKAMTASQPAPRLTAASAAGAAPSGTP